MRKKIRYKSGDLSLEFWDKAPLYLESIDATSLSGNFAVSTLARSVGQVTDYRTVGSRTIICNCAVWVTDGDQILDEIIALFNPLRTGTLTITTDSGEYEIDCYPQAVPQIKNDDNRKDIYRFEVDFVCDYPFFRESHNVKKNLNAGTTKIYSDSVIDTPVEIAIPARDTETLFVLANSVGNFALSVLPCSEQITVDTKTFTAVSENGQDISNKIAVASQIEDFKLVYGLNSITSSVPFTLCYYNLTLGVI